MNYLNFYYVRAKNILCFGPDGIEIHFKDYGPVVEVKGINLDAPGTSDQPASNGTGKSSIQELLSIGLFGETVQNPTKNHASQILNTLADEGEVEIRWDDYRLLRNYKRSKAGTMTSKLFLWKSPEKVWDNTALQTKGANATQDEIDKAIGLSHHAFCNVVIFDDSNTYSFLEAKTEVKREIVENLLNLSQYKGYHSNAKDELKALKDRIKVLSGEYEKAGWEVDASERRIKTVLEQEENWKRNKQSEITTLRSHIAGKQKQLTATDNGEQLERWSNAQSRITHLTDEITDLESKRTKVLDAIKNARTKLEDARKDRDAINEGIHGEHLLLNEVKAELNKTLKLVGMLENLKEGAQCPYCLGTINRDNYGEVLDKSRAEADKCRHRMDEQDAVISSEMQRFGKKSATVTMMEDKLGEADAKVAMMEGVIRKHRTEISQLSQLKKPEGTVNEQVLEVEITQLRKSLKDKEAEAAGDSPYKEIAAQAVAEKAQKEADKATAEQSLKDAEDEVPYLQYWIEAFGDNGIRKYVIDGIIPALNSRVAYWLQILIDGLLDVTFDNKLEQTITRKGNPAHYHKMSNGERRRINLAVSQAFAYVMMLDSGACPSLVFLDEITGGGIDRAGIGGVHNMIFELAKERQVFVTTHNETLMRMMQGCESITLKKQNDVTVLVS